MDFVVEGGSGERTPRRCVPTKLDTFGLAEWGVGAMDLVVERWSVGLSSEALAKEGDAFFGNLTAQIVGELAGSGGVGDFGETTLGIVSVGNVGAIRRAGMGELKARGIVGVGGSYVAFRFLAVSLRCIRSIWRRLLVCT